MNKKYRYYLISGLILALGLMFGTAIGANVGNIKTGIAFGILFELPLFCCFSYICHFFHHKKDNEA